MNKLFILGCLITATSFGCSLRNKVPEKKYKPKIMHGVLKEAERNGDWKDVAATAKNAQIVFMNISPETNPKNELGTEVHPFDQVIYIIDGWARVTLDGETNMAQAGDMILIPSGIKHNVKNLNQKAPLKIISFYTDQDIPEGAMYRTKADEMDKHSNEMQTNVR